MRTVSELSDVYQASRAYARLSAKTKESYDSYNSKIQSQFGKLPVEMFDERGARTVVRQWRDDVLASKPRTADATIDFFRLLLNFAVDEEYIYRNPIADLGHIHKLTRREIIWSDDQISTFLSKAPRHLARVLLFAIWTGQRQADILSMEWSCYDGQYLRFQQKKSSNSYSGRRVKIFVSAELRDVLAEIESEQIARSEQADEKRRIARPNTILTTANGAPWRGGFKCAWRKAVANVGISGVTFHDLRGTFITLAYRSGSPIKEIAEASGHYEADCEHTIRQHYLASGAESVIERLETTLRFAAPKWRNFGQHGKAISGRQIHFTGPRYPRVSTGPSQSSDE